MLSKTLEKTLIRAISEAKSHNHEYATVEHLLYGLIHDDLVSYIINGCGGSIETLKELLEKFFEDDFTTLPLFSEREPLQSLAFNRVLQRAVAHVQRCGKKEVDSGDVLVSLFSEVESRAFFFLSSLGLCRMVVVKFISREIPDGLQQKSLSVSSEGSELQEVNKEDKALKDYTVNLARYVEKGYLDPLIGRDLEISRIMQVLCRRKNNNLMLIGEPGVGKTSVVEGLALRIHEDKLARRKNKKPTVPDLLQDVEIHQLDMGVLMAGTKYRGDFEKKFKSVLSAIKNKKNAILFIDEMHILVGTGATSGGSMDASSLLKPALQDGRLRCIGSTTYEEYKNHIEKDRALSRRFQKIDLREPSVDDTILILRGLQGKYEQHHQVRYSKNAIKAMAELSKRYINERFLPDKAIDVMDEVGSMFRLEGRLNSMAKVGDVEKVVSRIVKIQPRSGPSSDISALKELASKLQQVIFGQDEAIETVVSAVKRSRAGLGEPDSPLGSFLFTGPTGVGKSEVARQLAQTLGVHFECFDMSEYMEKHAVSRLIGSPPGYIGFDQGGLLTEAIRRHPYSVLLLDEIEKAHVDIVSIFLQVMDHSALTDSSGRKADFRNVIIIMTTNAGALELAANSIGFMNDKKGEDKTAINNFFDPEFRNRLDAVVSFTKLDTETVEKVVVKLIKELEEQLAVKKVSIRLSAAARTWLATKGYNLDFGTRPLRRLILKEIGDTLAEEILFGELGQGGEATVNLKKDELTFKYTR